MKKVLLLLLALVLICSFGTTIAVFAEGQPATYVFEDTDLYRFSTDVRDGRTDGVFGPFRIEKQDIGGTTASISRDIYYSGHGSMVINAVNLSEGFNITLATSPNIPKNAKISMMVYLPEESPIYDINMEYFDTDWKHSSAIGDNPTKVDLDATKKGEWQKLEFEATASQNELLFFIIAVFGPEDMNGDILYIDDIKITDRNGNMVECTENVVEPKPGEVTGIKLSENSLVIPVGEKTQLSATVSPEDALNKQFTWAIDKPEIATISETGEITALATGTALVTATTADGAYTSKCSVHVIKKAEEIELSNDTVTIAPTETFKLSATVLPNDATNTTVRYSSSDEKVCTVTNSGKIKAIAPGTATITAVNEDSSITATCVVTVKKPSIFTDTFITILTFSALGVVAAAAILIIILIIFKKRKAKKALKNQVTQDTEN